MKKEKLIFCLLLVFGLVCSNLYISNAIDLKFEANFEFLNIASAQAEGGGEYCFTCYNSFVGFEGARTLLCGGSYSCCYKKDAYGVSQGGTCSGYCPDC